MSSTPDMTAIKHLEKAYLDQLESVHTCKAAFICQSDRGFRFFYKNSRSSPGSQVFCALHMWYILVDSKSAGTSVLDGEPAFIEDIKKNISSVLKKLIQPFSWLSCAFKMTHSCFISCQCTRTHIYHRSSFVHHPVSHTIVISNEVLHNRPAEHSCLPCLIITPQSPTLTQRPLASARPCSLGTYLCTWHQGGLLYLDALLSWCQKVTKVKVAPQHWGRK